MAKHDKHPPRTGPDWLKQPPLGSGKLKIGRPACLSATLRPVSPPLCSCLCTWQIIIIDEICN